MRLVPGPGDVRELVDRGAHAVEQLLGIAPAAVRLVDEAGELVTRAKAVLDSIEETSAGAQQLVRRTQAVVEEAERLVERTGPLTERLGRLLDSTEPSLTALQPTLERLAETTDPKEVDALVSVVDHLPVLAMRLETDVIPVLASLGTVSDDVHHLLEVSLQLNERLASLPGLGFLRRRADEEPVEEIAPDGGATA